MVRVEFRIVVLLALAALFGAGCDEKLTPQDMADRATEELGIPVFLWGRPAEDACLARQIKALYDEYSQAKDPGKRAIIQSMKRYTAIVVKASEDVGTIKKVSYELELVGKDDVVAKRSVRDWKQSSEWQSSSGKYPGTRVEKGEQLMILPAVAKDLSVKRVFATFNSDLYQNMGSTEYVDIESSYRFGTIQLVSQQNPDPVNCGKLVQFRDLK